MSNQPEHEMQPTLSPEDVRQALLAELEASQQALAELSDEQLQAIAGGSGSDHDARITEHFQKANGHLDWAAALKPVGSHYTLEHLKNTPEHLKVSARLEHLKEAARVLEQVNEANMREQQRLKLRR